MNAFSVIIPSKTASNIVPCIQRLYEMEPELSRHAERIIVIDDGIESSAPFGLASRSIPGPKQGQEIDVTHLGHRAPQFILGAKPFVFARNVNIGIKWVCDTDVIVLNDDALLDVPQGFTMLHQIGLANPEYGIIASACNNVGNERQFRQPGDGLRDEPRMVCLIAVWLRRKMLDEIGLLDERYVGYGVDDDDLCFTARAAGWKIGIYDGCYVDHGSLRSSYRGDPTAPADFRPNLRLFMEKWGHDNRGIPNGAELP